MPPHTLLLPSGGDFSLRSQIRRRLRHGDGGQRNCSLRLASAPTVFDCAFAPPNPEGTGYLLGCGSSLGVICIWDVDEAAREAAASSMGSERVGDEWVEGKRRKRVSSSPLESRGAPILHIQVVDERGVPSSGSLYRLVFFGGEGGVGASSLMLAACGDGGVFLYRWPDLLTELDKASDGSATTIRPTPASVLRPHPSPFGQAEINCVDYDPTSNVLYGASGDSFGGPCAWDIETGTLLGNLGSTLATSNSGGVGVVKGRRRNASKFSSRRSGKGHCDYLHSVKVFQPSIGGVGARTVLTGGEDGKLGVWDGKERRLVELVDIRSSLGACPPNSVSYDGGGAAPSKMLGNGGIGGLWVSSVDVSPSSSWVAVGGGIKSVGGVSSLSSSSSGKRYGTSGKSGVSSSSSVGGYVSLFSLPSRTPTSAYLTRETVNDIAYHTGLADGSLLTVGNESVLSRWNGADLSGGRVGRTWMGCTAGFGLAVDPFLEAEGNSGNLSMETARVAIAGAGGSIDIFSHVGNRSFGLNFQ